MKVYANQPRNRGNSEELFTKPPPDDPGVEDEESADVTARKILWGVVAITAIAIGAVLYACVPAKAQHHGPAGPNHWYENDCCNFGDCEYIAAEMVRETPAGYVTTIRPGTHPKWPITRRANLVLTYAYHDKKVRPSRDAFWHVCIRASGEPLCLYVIGGGF